MFVEGRIKPGGRTILLRVEGFNLFNHGNILGRAQTTYGDTATVNPTFGQVVAVGTATNAHSGARQHRSAANCSSSRSVTSSRAGKG